VVESGTFWLSDTPTEVGSKSWGNTVVRICTWAKFRASDGLVFTVFNTHFDHESQPSRERSADLVVGKASSSGLSVVMGDLNAGETNAAVTRFKTGGFVDTFRKLHADETQVGTFTAFDAKRSGGEKIDYVFASAGWEVLSSGIDRTVFDGRPPSDHFPVWAMLAH
jgi:endonuclease/exonuclease/phosphatase family metal-dependent hydrolase